MALWTSSKVLFYSNCRRRPTIRREGQRSNYFCGHLNQQPEEFLMTRLWFIFRLFVIFPGAVISHAPKQGSSKTHSSMLFTSREPSTTVWPLTKLLSTNTAAISDRPPIFWTPPATIQITVSLQEEISSFEGEDVAEALTKPLISEAAWNTQSGSEFQTKPALVQQLALTGKYVAANDNSDEWIQWRLYKDDPNDISVWTGKCKKAGCYGAHLPLIKSRSIIPLSCQDVVDLMMDSSKVPMYNTWSLGRKDCWVRDAHTKIVQNRVQPPIGSKQVVSTTLLHACEVDNNAWVIVSRAVRGFPEPEDASKTEILLGVNLVEPISDNSCRLTSVNHVYTSGLPTILAERLGVNGAIKFVNDLRRLRGEGKI